MTFLMLNFNYCRYPRKFKCTVLQKDEKQNSIISFKMPNSSLNRICSLGVWMLCWLTTLSQFAICPIKIFSFKQVSDKFLIFVLSYFYDWWSNKFAKHSKQFASWWGPMTCRFSDPQASYLLDAAFTELSLTTFEEDPTWPYKPILWCT